jgi:aromatic-L-amino-acid/L-tryptophan decarboxylase
VDDRHAPIDLDAEEFRRLGHNLVDEIADFLGTLPERRVAPGETADEVRDALARAACRSRGRPRTSSSPTPPACSSSTRP